MLSQKPDWVPELFPSLPLVSGENLGKSLGLSGPLLCQANGLDGILKVFSSFKDFCGSTSVLLLRIIISMLELSLQGSLSNLLS